MGKFLLSILLAGAVLFAQAAASADQFQKGKTLYEDKCMLCHGVKGNGKGAAAAAFSPAPADFTTQAFWKKKKDMEQFISTTVKKGYPPMPAFDLAPDQIQAIIDYITHTFKP